MSIVTNMSFSGMNTSLTRPLTVKRSTVLIGHSFISRALNTTDFGPFSGQPAANCINYSRSIFDRANILMNAPFDVVATLGVSGETSAQILARFSAATAYLPGWIVLDCFSNDPFNSVEVSTSISNTITMIDQAKAIGANVVLLLDIPRGSAAQMTQAILTKFMQYSAYFQDYAAKNSGVVVFNQWPYFVDYTSYTTAYQGTPDPAYINADTIHPIAAGAGRAAVGLAALLKPLIAARPQPLSTNSNNALLGDTTNITKNPLAVAGSGGYFGTGMSGANPQDWYGARVVGSAITGVSSIVTRASIGATFPGLFDDGLPGNVCKIAVSAATAADEQLYMGCRPYDAGAPFTANTGPWYYEMEFAAEATAGTINTCFGVMIMKTSGADFLVTTNDAADTGEYLLLTKFYGKIRSRPFYVPPTFSGANSTNNLALRFGTSIAGTANVYLSRPILRLLQA